MLYLVLFFLLSLFIAILFLSIEITIEYTRNEQIENKNIVSVSVSLLRRLINFKLKKNHIIKMKKTIRKKKYFESGISRAYHLFEVYRKNMDFMLEYRNFINSKFKVKNYSLMIEFGTGDAAISGFLYGLIWAVTSTVEASIFGNMKVEDREVKIKANFDQKCLYLNFNCIFSVKIVHIIVGGLKVFKWYSKKKYISKGGDVVG